MNCAVLYEASRKLIWVLPPLLRAHARAHAPCPRLCLAPGGTQINTLLCIQEPAIIEHCGGRPINSITGFTIANRVNRFICKEPLAFKRNTGYAIGLYFDFPDVGVNKLNVCDVLT